MQFNVFNVYSVNLRMHLPHEWMHLRILFVGSKRLASQDYKSNHDEKKVQAPRANVSINLRVYICSELAKQKLEKSQALNAVSCFVLWQALARHAPGLF